MLGPILAAIWRAVAGPVAILLAAGLVWQSAQLAVARHDLKRVDAERLRAVADLNTCHASKAALETGVAAQNRAVDALRAESEARVAQSREALSAARKSTVAAQQRVGAILSAKADGDLCVAAEALIRGTVQ